MMGEGHEFPLEVLIVSEAKGDMNVCTGDGVHVAFSLQLLTCCQSDQYHLFLLKVFRCMRKYGSLGTIIKGYQYVLPIY